MLKTIDWYIIKKFLRTFFFTVFIFVVIAVAIDFSEKVEKFIESAITKDEIWLQYYPTFILFISGMLWPLLVLIAVIFFTSRMASNSEIISIFNAGVSFRRLLRPYLVAGVFLAGVHFISSSYFIPKGNKTRLDIEHAYLYTHNDKGKKHDVHLFVAPNTKVFVNDYRKKDSTIRNFRLEHFKDGEIDYILKANPAEWLGPPNRWRLKNYQIRKINGMHETFEMHQGATMDTTINFSPDDFVDFVSQQAMLTSPELKKVIEKRTERGAGGLEKYKVELYKRYAEPITIIILILIGVSISARKVRGGIGMHLAIGMGIGAMLVLLSKFVAVFANSQLISPLLGVWIPNIVFGLVAFYLVRGAQN